MMIEAAIGVAFPKLHLERIPLTPKLEDEFADAIKAHNISNTRSILRKGQDWLPAINWPSINRKAIVSLLGRPSGMSVESYSCGYHLVEVWNYPDVGIKLRFLHKPLIRSLRIEITKPYPGKFKGLIQIGQTTETDLRKEGILGADYASRPKGYWPLKGAKFNSTSVEVNIDGVVEKVVVHKVR